MKRIFVVLMALVSMALAVGEEEEKRTVVTELPRYVVADWQSIGYEWKIEDWEFMVPYTVDFVDLDEKVVDYIEKNASKHNNIFIWTIFPEPKSKSVLFIYCAFAYNAIVSGQGLEIGMVNTKFFSAAHGFFEKGRQEE